MKIRKLKLGSVMGLCLLTGGIVIAQNPSVENIDPARHPHLAAAQHHLRMAWDESSAAQHANDWDMSGHAAHARQLMEEASRELKMAAEAANRR